MFSKTRTYIKARLASIDSDFKEWKDAFNFSNIPNSNFNKSFHYSYSAPSIGEDSQSISYSLPGELKIFYKGFRDPQDALDAAMDEADTIVADIVSPRNVDDARSGEDYPITNVFINSIVPTPIDTNDNKIEITIGLTFALYRGKC